MRVIGQTRTIIRKYGYEYVLVEVDRRAIYDIPQPCFMGFPNMALQSCRKITDKEIIKKKKK